MSTTSKYIFFTGGVVSSLGKGITAASLAAVLEAAGRKVTLIKLDPYINVDPGTMSPFQHGEVFVTDDGAETDLDLGNYERFTSTSMRQINNCTAGRIYRDVIARERRGEYLGATVQVIPHITDMIKHKIMRAAQGFEITLVEVGGTVGDIESLPFLEAIRQMRIELGVAQTLFIHLTLVPYIAAAGEHKTKPTQHSVKELRSIGIQPDLLVCRSEQCLSQARRDKIALFTNVAAEDVISLPDVSSIYQIPLMLAQQSLGQRILTKLQLQLDKSLDLKAWEDIVDAQQRPQQTVRIAMVGKYMELADAYKSLNEALVHAGIHTKTQVKVDYIDSEDLQQASDLAVLYEADAILVPGGFGQRGIEGKIRAIQFARVNNIPYLGICLGMQLAVVEFARNVAGLQDAHSTEFNSKTAHPVVALATEWQADDGEIQQRQKDSDLGGSMRLGGQHCVLQKNTKAQQYYTETTVRERHRHRYEVNPQSVAALEAAGLVVCGRSRDGKLVEMVELADHPWFIACQFHPEFTSTPRRGHPLFKAFVQAAQVIRKQRSSGQLHYRTETPAVEEKHV